MRYIINHACQMDYTHHRQIILIIHMFFRKYLLNKNNGIKLTNTTFTYKFLCLICSRSCILVFISSHMCILVFISSHMWSVYITNGVLFLLFLFVTSLIVGWLPLQLKWKPSVSWFKKMSNLVSIIICHGDYWGNLLEILGKRERCE